MSEERVERIRAVYQECEAAIAEQEWETALEGFRNLLPLLTEVDDHIGAARILLQMGQLAEQLNQPEQAGEYYQQVGQLAEQLSDDALRAAVLHRQAHLVRMIDPQKARQLFQASVDLDTEDGESYAISLAMIGQIDFTEGEQIPGLATMLAALTRMPTEAASRGHLIEHIVYFGGKLSRDDYERLVKEQITKENLLQQLLQQD